MIELNLKFKKCACNENIINISKENLQKEQRNCESARAVAAVTSTTTTTTTTFSKEGKSKKLLQLNKDNLNSLVNKLNDTNSSSSSCTKCRLSLDINNILTQIVSDRELKREVKQLASSDQDTVDVPAAAPAVGSLEVEVCNRTLKVGSPSSEAASWSPLLPSPCSPSPSPSYAAPDDPNRLQRRHSENVVERRSIGIQHGLRPIYRKKAPLRKGKTQAEEIIVISDEFRRQSLSDQKVRISRARKISQSMESIDPKQEVKVECLHLEEDTLTVVLDSGTPANNGHAKSKSKSVDDISLSSNHNEEKFGPINPNSTAANSVELIFISDEFVQRKTKTSSDIIIVDGNRKSFKRRKSSSKNLVFITDDQKASSTNQNEVKIVKSSSLKGPKDPRRKTTISNSNSFLTYEEPFSPETLESKDIGTMFAEASAAEAEAASK